MCVHVCSVCVCGVCVRVCSVCVIRAYVDNTFAVVIIYFIQECMCE